MLLLLCLLTTSAVTRASTKHVSPSHGPMFTAAANIGIVVKHICGENILNMNENMKNIYKNEYGVSGEMCSFRLGVGLVDGGMVQFKAHA